MVVPSRAFCGPGATIEITVVGVVVVWAETVLTIGRAHAGDAAAEPWVHDSGRRKLSGRFKVCCKG